MMGIFAKHRDDADDAQLRQQALSELQRTVAHDFGNMIAAMGMSLSLAKLKYERQHDGVRQALDDAEVACERATKVAKQLIVLGRGDMGSRHVAALAELLQTVAAVCTKNANAPIEVHANLELYPVECDEVQVALVFHALIMTAVNANANGQRVPVVADNWDDPASGERWACFSVTYQASAQTAPPAFGLSQVQEIIAAHNGKLLREQNVMTSRVTFLLPAAALIG